MDFPCGCMTMAAFAPSLNSELTGRKVRVYRTTFLIIKERVVMMINMAYEENCFSLKSV